MSGWNMSKVEALVLLDVDETLIVDTGDSYSSGHRKRVVNNVLIEGLKALNLKKAMLFTNMSVGSDLNGWVDTDTAITRKKLIDYMAKQGVEVVAVAMPADVIYNKGPGAVFREIYMPAYKKLVKADSVQDERNKAEPFYKSLIDQANQLTSDLTACIKQEGKDEPTTADTKAKLFSYLLSQQKKDSCVMHYVDDDEGCLAAVANVLNNEASGASVNIRPHVELHNYDIERDTHKIPEDLRNAITNSDMLEKASEKFKVAYINKTAATTRCLLEMYLNQRDCEFNQLGGQYQHNSIWARVFSIGGSRSHAVKVSAAQKLLNYLRDDHQQLTKEELAACQNGRLSALIKANPILGYVLKKASEPTPPQRTSSM